MYLTAAKVVVLDYEYQSREPLLARLGEAGIQPVMGTCRTADEALQLACDADAILVGAAPLPRTVIANLQRCRVIVSFRSGVDNIDLAAASERHIPVCRTTGVNFDEVATHAVALLLALVRKIVSLNTLVHAGSWRYQPVAPLYRISGRTLGIVGFGMIGRSVARKMAGFDVHLLASDPYQTATKAAECGAQLVQLDELLRRADYVSLHAPLSDCSRHLIGRAELALLKPTALLVNTARGAVIDEQALYEALVEGRLAGAALDTLENEPACPTNALLALDNVIVTPHCGWYSEESTAQTVVQAAGQVIAALCGDPLQNVANP